MDGLRLILLILGVVLIAGIYVWETRRRRPKSLDDIDDLDTSYLDDLGDTRSRKDFGYALDPTPVEDETFDEDEEYDEAYDDEDDDAYDGEEYEDAEFDDGEIDAEQFVEETELEKEDLDLSLFAGEDTRLDGLEFIVPGGDQSTTPAAAVANDGLLIALTVMASPKTPFSGVVISQVMDELGFTFGRMQIFHYYSAPQSQSTALPQYSVANVLKPGTFDLSSIEEFSTPGIALFMQVSGQPGSVEAFDSMVETGTQLATRLGGELRDESRSTLTTQAINHLRERIVEFGRQRRLKSTE